jgi:hypothetical protein
MKITAKQVSTYSSEEVVRSDPEFADVGNPSGAVFRLVSRVLIELEDGTRILNNRGFSNPVDGNNEEVAAKVEALADRVRKAGEINLAHWFETHSVYGSLSWENEETERRHNLEVALRSGNYEAADRYA